MTAQVLRQVRGFDWQLAPLQRKLEWEVDAARAGVSRELARWEAAGSALRAAESLLRQASQDARRSVEANADPRAHRRMLDYLMGLSARVSAAEDEEQQAAGQLAAARQELLLRQRRLDMVLRARERALDAHLREMARCDQSRVDADWLALRELRRDQDALEGRA